MVRAVLDHPLRRRISREVLGSAQPVSLWEIAKRLREPLSSVNYHAHLLAGGKTPALVRRDVEPAGGTCRRLYAASPALSQVSLMLVGESPTQEPGQEQGAL
jgi:hypothetical protein